MTDDATAVANHARFSKTERSPSFQTRGANWRPSGEPTYWHGNDLTENTAETSAIGRKKTLNILFSRNISEEQANLTAVAAPLY